MDASLKQKYIFGFVTNKCAYMDLMFAIPKCLTHM